MTVATVDKDAPSEARASLLYDPVIRSIVFQVILAIFITYLIYSGITNAAGNLARAGIASGFDFLGERAGFEVSQALIQYTSDSTYRRAFFVGLLNTLLVSAIGIFFATIIGFFVGICRLSNNFLVRKSAEVYVEVLRNIPLLLQLLFWYKAVLATLPSPRGSYSFFNESVFLNNRGLSIPQFIPEAGATAVFVSVAVALAVTFGVGRWAKARPARTGQAFPTIRIGIAIIIGLPLLVFFLTGTPFTMEYPELGGFNFRGGNAVHPEFMALLLGLSLYTGAFIAEIVRSGIKAVSHGQTEAAFSLGLRPNTTMRLIIIPQALRVIIPPLTSQYLNLTKNSSLAVAIGYPDLVAVFSNTVGNQTGQAVEVILMTMLVYITLSLLTSAFMNWFNARVALVER